MGKWVVEEKIKSGYARNVNVNVNVNKVNKIEHI
jgi:hypothetical protein